MNVQDLPPEEQALLAGLSMITIINAADAPREACQSSGPNPEGKYAAYLVAPGGRVLISAAYTFPSAEEAVLHMQKVVAVCAKLYP